MDKFSLILCNHAFNSQREASCQFRICEFSVDKISIIAYLFTSSEKSIPFNSHNSKK